MGRPGIAVALVLALGCAGAAGLLAAAYLQQQGRALRQEEASVPVVVSAADLSFGRTLEAEDLRLCAYPEDSVPKGAVSSVDSLVGQTTKVFLAQGEAVLVSKLSSIGGGLSLLIAPDLRAVSVKVDKVSGVTGFILPGDRVDVVAVAKPSGAPGEAKSRIILQNVEVLAAGTETDQKGKEPLTVQTVTLLVDPSGAETLALADNEGKLHLALRNPNDTRISQEGRGLTKSELLALRTPPQSRPAGAAPVPAPRPAVPRADTLTILRGTDARKEPAAIGPLPGQEGKARVSSL
ncbi:MAG: Flp pilus assembly protein CpaB [Candidatus Latescibacterota bacterium]